MEVYILFFGVCHEGGSVVSVHRTYEGAKQAGDKYAEKNGMSPNNDRDWIKGCEYLEIQKVTVVE